MIRYYLARGDRAGNAVIIEGLDYFTCSNPPPQVEIATLYMKTYCSSCKQQGFIGPQGPRWPGTAPNGKPFALSGDINVCGCNPPPVFYAERSMSMTFTAEEEAALSGSCAGGSSPNSGEQSADENLEYYVEFVDSKTGTPIEGMTHKVYSNGEVLVSDEPLEAGKTRAFLLKEHPNLNVVAWIEGGVR
ncbi:hypothetical protein JOE11_000004 [Robbsia andropogonis]|uniref:hypothetical protein n=1 Tax=Robbsia andropogonis TaxID=28092 RepID=UPI003D23E632